MRFLDIVTLARGQLANASCYVIKQKSCASKKIFIAFLNESQVIIINLLLCLKAKMITRDLYAELQFDVT